MCTSWSSDTRRPDAARLEVRLKHNTQHIVHWGGRVVCCAPVGSQIPSVPRRRVRDPTHARHGSSKLAQPTWPMVHDGAKIKLKARPTPQPDYFIHTSRCATCMAVTSPTPAQFLMHDVACCMCSALHDRTPWRGCAARSQSGGVGFCLILASCYGPSQNKTETRERTRAAGRDAERHHWWGRQCREPRAVVRGARRAETAFGRP